MKKSDKIAIRQKSPAELHKTLIDLDRELVENRLKLASGNLKDTSLIAKVKYQIAFINTLLNQKTTNEKT